MLVLSLLLGVPLAEAAPLSRVVISSATTSQRCADGSMPVIYAKAATSAAHKNDWVIHLQGDAGPCWHDDPLTDVVAGVDMDATACSDFLPSDPAAFGTGCVKSGAAVTCGQHAGAMAVAGASPWGASVDKDGILGTAGANDFQTWNRVFVVACTPDDWSGTGGRLSLSSPPAGYTHLGTGTSVVDFNGKNVLNAVFSHLESTGLASSTFGARKLSNTAAHTVLLTGSGTGSAGVVANVDRLAAHLSAVDVRGVVDSEPKVFAFQDPLIDTALDTEAYWNDPGAPEVEVESACMHRVTTGVRGAGGSPGWPTLAPMWCGWATGDTSCDPSTVTSKPGDDSCVAAAGNDADALGQCLRVSVPIAFGDIDAPLFLRQDLLDPELLDVYDVALGDPDLETLLLERGVDEYTVLNPANPLDPGLLHREECFQETVLSAGWWMARNENVEGWFLSCGDAEMADSSHPGLTYNDAFLQHLAGPPQDFVGVDREVSFEELLTNWVTGSPFTRMARSGCTVHELDPWAGSPGGGP